MKTKRLTLSAFLEFVELKTKVASIFPMLIGFLWYAVTYRSFNWLNSLFFALAVLVFDMCTTAINNTLDYKKATDMTYKAEENVIGKYGLSYSQMTGLVFLLLGVALFFSLLLVFQTDVLLLPMGGLCFLIGICYTFGPLPLSRLPLGEVFSGITMGFGIFFLSVYVQDPSLLLQSSWEADSLLIKWQWLRTLQLFFMSLPLVCLIATIMLANNLCDYEQDIRNNRYTLVHYIGKRKGLILYTTLSLFPFGLWIVYGLMGLLPLWSMIGLLFFYPFLKNLTRFQKRQIKRETFVLSIKNFLLFSLLYLTTLVIVLCLTLLSI